jgi:hypothetical protein
VHALHKQEPPRQIRLVTGAPAPTVAAVPPAAIAAIAATAASCASRDLFRNFRIRPPEAEDYLSVARVRIASARNRVRRITI